MGLSMEGMQISKDAPSLQSHFRPSRDQWPELVPYAFM